MGKATVQFAWAEYQLKSQFGIARMIERVAVPRLRRAGRTVTRVLHTTGEASACAWCRARPSVWEMDCDGPWDTRFCNSPQCLEALKAWRSYKGPKPSYY